MLTSYLKLKFFQLTLERFPNLYRPSSKPFISGDTFRNMSNLVFDESSRFNPDQVKEKDIVFLNPDVIDVYFQSYHDKIKNNYYLITHNSSINISKYIDKYIDEKIIHWFGVNLEFKNPKATLIPMGLENLRRLRYGRKKWFRKVNINKSKYILCSFDQYKNFEARHDIKNIISENNSIDYNIFSSNENYFNSLNNYRFLLCPEGEGFDTSRIWEGLYLNVFPIFKLNGFSSILKELELPGIYLDEWNELNNFDKKYFETKYAQLTKKTYPDIQNYSYWKNIFEKLD